VTSRNFAMQNLKMAAVAFVHEVIERDSTGGIAL
jgi:hypothetical protein